MSQPAIRVAQIVQLFLSSLRLLSRSLLFLLRRRATLLGVSGSDSGGLTRPFGGFLLLLLWCLSLAIALLGCSLLAAIRLWFVFAFLLGGVRLLAGRAVLLDFLFLLSLGLGFRSALLGLVFGASLILVRATFLLILLGDFRPLDRHRNGQRQILFGQGGLGTEHARAVR